MVKYKIFVLSCKFITFRQGDKIQGSIKTCKPYRCERKNETNDTKKKDREV